MTRAMEKLVLTYAEQRRIYGQELFHKVSRFISEIPADTLHEVRLQTRVEKPASMADSITQPATKALSKRGIH